MPKRIIGGAGAAWAIVLATAAPAWAAPASEEPDLSIQAQPINQWTGVWTRSTLLGDMGGLRTWMGNYGLSLGVTETSEYLYNAGGGLKTGGAYDGLTTATLQLDTQKAFGWQGGTFNASFMNLHGSDLSQTNLGSLNTVSGIEQPQNWTRLWELWYDQKLPGNHFDVKIGQQSLDQEFMTSQNAGLFVNTMMGWPGVPSYDMPNGGPAYPLSALGVRLRAQITPSLTALVGVFDGNPLGNDPSNLHGTNFNVQNSALFIGELQYSINGGTASEGGMVSPDSYGLPGVYKVGVWYNTGSFADQRYDNTGLSLADPNSSGVAQQ
ncbi:MAG: carbohydrate porin, partial [Bordetella sp.]|uniref:carbohydrate porin n=1 Tax=Bordetella sp. TaxID=28081 RepID=UPI003F7C1B03